MESILQGLVELGGVSATLVFDGHGQLVGHRGHAIYDQQLLEQVSALLVRAIDSVQLHQADWDAITAQFQDGTLLLRNLGAAQDGQSYVLAVIADVTLNASFATVALRVAVNKLKRALDGSPSSPSQPSMTPAPAASSRPQVPVASSGVSWSKASQPAAASAPAAGSSPGASSGVAVADQTSSAFLTRCAKELARHVGPMSKVYVKEAVRRVCGDEPFSMTFRRALVDDLARQIEDVSDRGNFRRAIERA